MPRITIDAATAPVELLLAPVRGVPLVVWPLRHLWRSLPLSQVAVMTSEPAIVGLMTRHGVFPIPPSPATRADPGLLIDPLQPFFTEAALRAALGANSTRLSDVQQSPIERLRAEDLPTFRLVDAVARGLSPEDPVLGGIERLRAPLTLSIRGVIADVDGTLTDGGVTFADQPDSARTFSTRDGLGTHLLVQAGIKVGWLSATSSGVSIRQRAAQLKLEHVDAAEGPKGPRFLALCAAMNLPPQDVAYLGDDVNDLPAMRLAGLAACPCDAHSSVRNQVGLVLDAPGGRGAFRELADLILAGLSSS